VTPDGEGLREYQRQAVAFTLERAATGILLALDVGLGKTNVALRSAKALGQHTVVVCPSYVRGVWGIGPESQVKQWWPEAYPPTVLEGTTPDEKLFEGLDASSPRLFAIHYDVLYAWADLLAEHLAGGTFIADEVHALQGRESRRSRAAKHIAAAMKYRIGLSATPMTARPRDLWNVVDTLSPGRFGSYWTYAVRYAGAHREQVTDTIAAWKDDGASNLDELRTRLETFMLRRTKSDVALELPSRTRQVLEIEVPRKFQTPLSRVFDSDKAFRAALNVAADGKVGPVVDLALSHVQAGHQIVVWCHRRDMVDAVHAGLVTEGVIALPIHGGYALKERLAYIRQRPQALVATMDSIGAGVDISYADVGIFAELDWVPYKIIQVEGRQHRFGASRPVLFQYVIARGTVDEVIRSVVIHRLDNFAEGVGKLDDGLSASLKDEGVSPGGDLKVLQGMFERLSAMEANA
jgi:SWI/SNF-related matrix-associated actin-dependent regulator 1 of chromatin subfamily A